LGDSSSGAASSSNRSGEDVRRLKRQIEILKEDLRTAKEALSSEKSRDQDLTSAKWIEERSRLEKELLSAKDQVASLTERLRKRDSWEKDFKDLQKRLDDAVADKAVAEELYQQREKETKEVFMRFASELQEANRKVGDGALQQKKIDELSREVERGCEALKQLQAKLDQAQKESKDSAARNLELQVKYQQTAAKLAEASSKQTMSAERKFAAARSALDADRAVIEEERSALQVKLAEATRQAGELGRQVSLIEPLRKQSEDLNEKLAGNTKELEDAKARLAAAEKVLTAEREENRRTLAAAQSVKDLLEHQNASLQEEFKGAMARLTNMTNQVGDSAALQEQLKSLRDQLDANAKTYSESQRQLAEVTTARPEQEKILQEKEKALEEAKGEAEKLRNELASANQKTLSLQKQAAEGEDHLKQLQDQLAEMTQKTPAAAAAEGEAGNLRKESEALRTELASAKEKLATAEGSINQTKELEKKLAEKEQELVLLKKRKRTKIAALLEKTAEENNVLRGIVIRQVKEEARKAQARRLLDEEMKRLNVQSQSLSEQLAVLSTPSASMTPEERALFKEGQLVIVEESQGAMQLAVAAPIDSKGGQQPLEGTNERALPDTNAPVAPSPSNETNAPVAPSETPSPTGAGSKEIPWQGKFKECLARAKEEFDRQDFLQAEHTFKEALGYSPDDYFALSNLGVVEFQLGKLKEAEEVLLKAASKSSDSSFALTTLGIVHYRQGRLEDAEKALRKAIAKNDQDFTAHNYLGIVLAASGKGKAGESEIMKAIEINQGYADAHFNLAVIYATGKPPSKMMARKHYAKAIELGAPPDASLERLVQ
jgi:Flp pilus assembly protein TadD